jgi:hypothetical protein
MTPKECARCLLTEDVPGVKIGDSGQCSVCTDHDRDWGNWNEIKGQREAYVEKLFEKAKKKKAIYDVLVPLSGGKDSTYVLYLCRKRYGLKCLAYTFDNGFLSDHARENIRKTCETLGVDHIYFTMDRDLTMRLYRYAFLKTGYLCPVCLTAMGAPIGRIQKAFGIPLAVKGTSPRTEEYVAPEYFVSSNDFVENVYTGSPLEAEARLLLEPVGVFKSPPSLQLPLYLDWNYDQIFKTIQDELGWRAHTPKAEHTDCAIDNIVNWIRFKRFPALVPEMLRFSKLATIGQMTREEAARAVAAKAADTEVPPNLPLLLDALKITREEFDAAVANPLKHLPYLKSRSRVSRRLKALARRIKP